MPHLKIKSQRAGSAFAAIRSACSSLRSTLRAWRVAAPLLAGAWACASTLRAESSSLTIFPSSLGFSVTGSLVEAPDGNLYGSNSVNGGGGYIFQLTPDGVGSVVHAFTRPAADGTNADGYGPQGSLLVGQDGNLYGTTGKGGAAGRGTFFQLTTGGQFKVLTNFDTNLSLTGQNAGLVQDRQGNFYGVNQDSVIKIAPDGTPSLWHRFSPLNTDYPYGNYDGSNVRAGLGIDAADNIYGVSSSGGVNGAGTIFELSPTGVFSTLYNFTTSDPGHGEATGPVAVTSDGVLYYTSGNVLAFSGGSPAVVYSPSGFVEALYGVTLGQDGAVYGASVPLDFESSGVLFKIGPGGGVTALYTFPPKTYTAIAPTLGTDGNVYGSYDFNDSADGADTFYRLGDFLVPSITSAPTVNLALGAVLSYQIIATHGATSYLAAGLPAGLTLDPATGLISGVLTAAGVSTVQLSAINGDGAGHLTLTITVAAPSPDAPVITPPASPLQAQLNNPFLYQIDASKGPSNYTASGLPPGLTVDPATGLIHGTATNFGNFLVEIQAANASGEGTASFEIDVAEAAALPVATVVGSDPNANARTGQVGYFTVTLSAVSAVNVKVAYTVSGSAQPGVDYQGLNGVIKIKAGQTSKKIAVVPRSAAATPGPKVVKLVLRTGKNYTVGTTDKVKVKILHP